MSDFEQLFDREVACQVRRAALLLGSSVGRGSSAA
jgi:hypothetical protein